MCVLSEVTVGCVGENLKQMKLFCVFTLTVVSCQHMLKILPFPQT